MWGDMRTGTESAVCPGTDSCWIKWCDSWIEWGSITSGQYHCQLFQTLRYLSNVQIFPTSLCRSPEFIAPGYDQKKKKGYMGIIFTCNKPEDWNPSWHLNWQPLSFCLYLSHPTLSQTSHPSVAMTIYIISPTILIGISVCCHDSIFMGFTKRKKC